MMPRVFARSSADCAPHALATGLLNRIDGGCFSRQLFCQVQ
jgi:hypothetical protein